MQSKSPFQLLRGNLLLVLTAVIWGSAFVAQSAGMEYVQPFTFNGVRSLLGGLFLIPVAFLMDAVRRKDKQAVAMPGFKNNKLLWVGGLICGVLMFVATNLQQFGIASPEVTSGKAGFLTALYIVLVPLLGLFFKRKVPWFVWIGVALAMGGLWLLCAPSVPEAGADQNRLAGLVGLFSFSSGEWLLLGCALAFAVHILVIDHFAPLVDGVRLSCIQFLVSGVLSVVSMFLFESPDWQAIWSCKWPILYTGILSSGVAYTLQILAQKDMPPTLVSLMLSLESVFAALSGWLFLQQTMRPHELFGCFLVFAAIVLAQLPAKQKAARTADQPASKESAL